MWPSVNSSYDKLAISSKGLLLTHRYPVDRNFEPGEFAALFQPPENELELIFKGDFSYSAIG